MEVLHIENSARRFPDHRKCLGQDIIKRLALRQTLLEFGRLRGKLLVAHLQHLGPQGLDPVDDGADPLQLMIAVCAEYFSKDAHERISSLRISLPQKTGRSLHEKRLLP